MMQPSSRTFPCFASLHRSTSIWWTCSKVISSQSDSIKNSLTLYDWQVSSRMITPRRAVGETAGYRVADAMIEAHGITPSFSCPPAGSGKLESGGSRQPSGAPVRYNLHSGWPFDLSFCGPCARPRLQRHPDQCCDQDRGVQLPDERFCHGQRSRNAMYWIRVTVTYGREGCKTEVDQTGWFTCGNSSEGRLEVDCVRNLFQEQLVTERPGHADQQIGGDAAHDPVHTHRAGTKCLLQRHDHEYGHAGHF